MSGDIGKPVGSFDNAEDAIECLNRDGAPWLLLVGNYTKGTSFYSNLSPEINAVHILDWCDDGRMIEYVREHIYKQYPHLRK